MKAYFLLLWSLSLSILASNSLDTTLDVGEEQGSNISPTRLHIGTAIWTLSTQPNSMISPPKVPLSAIVNSIRALLPTGDPLHVFYIGHLGSQGDVSTSASLWRELLQQPRLFEVKAAIDPRSKKYLPNDLAIKNEARNLDDVDSFVTYVHDLFLSYTPNIIISAHAFEHHYTSVQWSELQKPMLARATGDSAILLNLQSFFAPLQHRDSLWWLHRLATTERHKGVTLWVMKQVQSIAVPETNIPIEPNMVTLFGQQSEFWNNANSSEIGGIMIGKLETVSKSSVRTEGDPVFEFIRTAKSKKKKILYLGFGGPLRPQEAYSATPALYQFVQLQLSLTDAWEFIIFHNSPRSTVESQQNEKESGLYHLYYGDTDILSIFKKVDLALHHGGAGTVSDCIAAGIPQIIIPNIASDQSLQALRIDDLGMGVALQPITDLGDYPSSWIQSAFDDITVNYDQYTNRVEPMQKEATKLAGASNAIEVILRLTEGLLRRAHCRESICRRQDAGPDRIYSRLPRSDKYSHGTKTNSSRLRSSARKAF